MPVIDARISGGLIRSSECGALLEANLRLEFPQASSKFFTVMPRSRRLNILFCVTSGVMVPGSKRIRFFFAFTCFDDEHVIDEVENNFKGARAIPNGRGS